MAQLLNRPYWNRVCIQQELHNNPQVFVHCGHTSAPLEWWSRTVEAHEQLAEENNYIGGIELPAKHFSIVALPMKVCAMRRRFRDKLRSEQHICEVLNDQMRRGVTDPRDRIYGVFDLMNEKFWHAGNFEVDYNYSPHQVYTKAVRAVVMKYKSLDILTRVFPRPAETRLEGLPTWCPDWTDFPKSQFPNGPPGLEFTDIEHHLNKWGDNKFDACRNIGCYEEFYNDGMILTVFGIAVDTIKDVLDSPWKKQKAFELDFSHEAQERIIGITKSETSSVRKETWWRTLISNREWSHFTDPYDEPEFHSAPVEFGARFESWVATSRLESANPVTFNDDLPNTIEDRGAVYHENAEILLPPGKRPDPGRSPKEVSDYLAGWLLPFVRACQIATTHRCFFLTEKDNMGLAPLHTRPGDIVVVLYGCALPVVLRPVGGHFEFVGQAYIHGWMTREAVDLAEKGELEEKFFEIH